MQVSCRKKLKCGFLVLFVPILLLPSHSMGQNPGESETEREVGICETQEFLTCLSGPGIIASDPCLSAFDFDNDQDVDLADFSAFQYNYDASPRLLDLPSRYTVIEKAVRVFRHWIDGHPDPGHNNWDRATCFEGLMGLYHQYPEPLLYDYSVYWGETHNWSLTGGSSTRHADHQTAGQVYLELYQYEQDPIRIAELKTCIDAMVESESSSDWWWIDAIQMALPVFAKFGELYDDPAYYNKGWDLFYHTYAIEGDQGLYSDNGVHDYGEYLWWRDYSFQPPTFSPNGEQVFWSRGNGWVFAGLARALQHMQPTDPHYDDYVEVFQEMAASLITRQQPDGFWPVNLDDPLHAQSIQFWYVDSPETSGTSFFTYGMAWGVRNGFLDAEVYGPAIVAAWDALVAHSVDDYGRLGWCQSVGVGPESSQPFHQYRTTDFGVGAFLLAASEVAQLACGPMPVPGEITVPFGEAWWGRGGYVNGNHDLGSDNTGLVITEYDIIPYSFYGLDGLVGYADSSTWVNHYSDNFALVRLYDGVFDAYNHDRYEAEAEVHFFPGLMHHVRLEINLETQQYDVWVTPPHDSPILIADDYGFRAAAGFADDVGQATLVTTSNEGDFVVYNHTVVSK